MTVNLRVIKVRITKCIRTLVPSSFLGAFTGKVREEILLFLGSLLRPILKSLLMLIHLHNLNTVQYVRKCLKYVVF